MELKDVILSTLAEMEENSEVESNEEQRVEKVTTSEQFFQASKEIEEIATVTHEVPKKSEFEGELMYLNSIRERLLVLFEGFQSPNNSNIEAKVDMTLNFLEYTLATIDARVEKLEKGVSL